MILEDLQAVLHREPFVPFRLLVTDGGSYEVRHPELCMAGRRTVVIGIPSDPSPVADHVALVDLVHVTRIEPLEATPPAASQRGGAA